MKKISLPNDLEKQLGNQEDEIFQLKNLVDTIPGDVYWKDKNGVWLGLNKRCEMFKTL